MIQPNGNPYSNPNIQNSNITNNSSSGLDAQNKEVIHQNYNKLPNLLENKDIILKPLMKKLWS